MCGFQAPVWIMQSILLRRMCCFVRNGEHIGISPLTNKRVQPRKDIAIYHHLLNYNYSATFEDFSVLCHENKKYLLELKESLLIMRDRPPMNRNVRSAPLYLFE